MIILPYAFGEWLLPHEHLIYFIYRTFVFSYLFLDEKVCPVAQELSVWKRFVSMLGPLGDGNSFSGKRFFSRHNNVLKIYCTKTYFVSTWHNIVLYTITLSFHCYLLLTTSNQNWQLATQIQHKNFKIFYTEYKTLRLERIMTNKTVNNDISNSPTL